MILRGSNFVSFAYVQSFYEELCPTIDVVEISDKQVEWSADLPLS